MLIMPCWPGGAHPLGQADASLPLLVDLLLAHARPGTVAAAAGAPQASGAGPGGAAAEDAAEDAAEAANTVDVRRVSALISAQLAEAAARQLELAQAAGRLSSEEAAAAAAVVQAAVSGSAAVAAAAEQAQADGLRGAQLGEEGEAEQQSPAPSRKRQVPEPDGVASAAAAAEAPSEEQAQGQQPRLSKRQRRELARGQQEAQQRAARTLALAAVSRLAASRGSSGGGTQPSGARLADINAYLQWAWSHLGSLAFGKTAKPALAAAIEAGLLEPAGDGAAAPAADAGQAAALAAATEGAGGEGRRFRAGGAYRLSAAGAAAAPQPQYVAELSHFCLQFGSQQELAAALQAAQQPEGQQLEGQGPEPYEMQQQERREGGQRQQQEQGQGAEEEPQQEQQQGKERADGTGLSGFFWERPGDEQQASPPEQQAEQQQPQLPAQHAQQAVAQPPVPAVLPPQPAPADLAALQRSMLLHAVAVLQGRRGVSADSAEQWVQGQLQARHPGLPLFAAEGSKAQKPQARALRSMLQLALRACEKVCVACMVGGEEGCAGKSPGWPAGSYCLHRLLLACSNRAAPPAAALWARIHACLPAQHACGRRAGHFPSRACRMACCRPAALTAARRPCCCCTHAPSRAQLPRQAKPSWRRRWPRWLKC